MTPSISNPPKELIIPVHYAGHINYEPAANLGLHPELHPGSNNPAANPQWPFCMNLPRSQFERVFDPRFAGESYGAFRARTRAIVSHDLGLAGQQHHVRGVRVTRVDRAPKRYLRSDHVIVGRVHLGSNRGKKVAKCGVCEGYDEENNN